MLTLIDSMGVQIESEFKVSYRGLNNYFLEFPGGLAVKGLASSLAQELLHAMCAAKIIIINMCNWVTMLYSRGKKSCTGEITIKKLKLKLD